MTPTDAVASLTVDSTARPRPSVGLTWQGAVLAGLIAWLYWEVCLKLVQDWWNFDSLSYGFLIPPLALYFAWMQRDAVLAIPQRSSARGLSLVALASLLYLTGKLGAEFFLQRISLVVLLAGITWTFWGYGRMRRLAFPFVLLAAMVPLPTIVFNLMAAPLQLFASDVAASVSRACGITVYRDGNVIHLANISLGVEEACSGLSSLTSLVIGSLLLGQLQCVRLRTRVALLLLAVPLAIAVNVARVSGTAILADYHEEFAMGFYHSFSGWLVFVAGLGGLYFTAKALHRILD